VAKRKKKHRRLARLLRPASVPRRRFLAQGLAALGVGAAIWAQRIFGPPAALVDARVFIPAGTLPIRPPTALADDKDFQAACVNCGLCGVVCDNGCIRFFGADSVEHGPLTPYLDVRRRSCTLCMKCTQVCPSGALHHLEKDFDVIKSEVRMGVAEVDPELCISYLGRVCGYCHDACPLPNDAIKLLPPATPVVQTDGCVGCGRCVEFCPQTPTAIAVVRRTA
jgi:MauM/NapG family ferredoxin protein